MIEGNIRTFLLAQPTVATVFGTKIYAGNIPEGIKSPMAVIYRISDVTGHEVEVQTLVIQVSNFATVYSDVVTHSDILNGLLKGFIGNMGGIQIVSVVAGNSNRLYDSTQKLWQSVRDYQIVLRK